MTVTIDVGSLILGFVIGLVISSITIAYSIFRDDGAWSIGFYKGWESGKKYAERIKE